MTVPRGRALVAAFAAAARELCTLDRLFRSALTAAQPAGVSMLVPRVKLKNTPQPEGLASQVFEAGVAASRMLISHSSLLCRFGWTEPTERYRALPVRFIIPPMVTV